MAIRATKPLVFEELWRSTTIGISIAKRSNPIQNSVSKWLCYIYMQTSTNCPPTKPYLIVPEDPSKLVKSLDTGKTVDIMSAIH